MTNYQKAIKVRKTCENQITCYDCEYYPNCFTSNIILYLPVDESITTVDRAIREEKWKV